MPELQEEELNRRKDRLAILIIEFLDTGPGGGEKATTKTLIGDRVTALTQELACRDIIVEWAEELPDGCHDLTVDELAEWLVQAHDRPAVVS